MVSSFSAYTPSILVVCFRHSAALHFSTLESLWKDTSVLDGALRVDVEAFILAEFRRCEERVLDLVAASISSSSSCVDTFQQVAELQRCARALSLPRSSHSECRSWAILGFLCLDARELPTELSQRILAVAQHKLAQVQGGGIQAMMAEWSAQRRASKEETPMCEPVDMLLDAQHLSRGVASLAKQVDNAAEPQPKQACLTEGGPLVSGE